jgi:cytochrome c-type biogenesis protein CcmH
MSWRLLGLTLALCLGALSAIPQPAKAVAVDIEALANPALDQRARAVARQLRCLVCQNQSIEDSNADLARDLRQLVRERMIAGDTDAQVIDYVVARYGDWVLLNPPVNHRTYILWLAPLAFAGLGLVGLILTLRRRTLPSTGAARPGPLSAEEDQRLKDLLDQPR